MAADLSLREDTPPAVVARLADTQQFLVREFERAGLTVEAVAETLLDVMKKPMKGEKRTEAVELYLSATYGSAPTRTRNENLSASIKTDKFFEASVFENPPPVLGAPAKSVAKKLPGKRAR